MEGGAHFNLFGWDKKNKLSIAGDPKISIILYQICG